MVDIVQYRCLIGLFRQKVFSRKFLLKQKYYENQNGNQTHPEEYSPLPAKIKKSFKLVVICVLLLSPLNPPSPRCVSTSIAATLPWSWSVHSSLATTTITSSSNVGRSGSADENICTMLRRAGWETGNFWARYMVIFIR